MDNEWKEERNQWGGVRRYRMIGHTKEYEATINGVPQSVIDNGHAKEQQAERIAEARRRAKEKEAQRRSCPFRDGIHTDCTREACALFLDGCTLSRLTPAKDTKGLQCPFSKYHYACRTDCALYALTGCTLTGIERIG